MTTHFAISTPLRSQKTIACSMRTVQQGRIVTLVLQALRGALLDTMVRVNQQYCINHYSIIHISLGIDHSAFLSAATVKKNLV